MTRREAIYELLNAFKYNVDKSFMDACDMAIDALQTEVVRCKDCQHYEKYETWSACTYWSGDPYEQATVIDEDFCSYAERREP